MGWHAKPYALNCAQQARFLNITGISVHQNAGVLVLRSLARRPMFLGAATLLVMTASLAITASLQDRTPVCRALSIDGATGAPHLEWGLILTKAQEIDCLRQLAAQL